MSTMNVAELGDQVLREEAGRGRDDVGFAHSLLGTTGHGRSDRLGPGREEDLKEIEGPASHVP